MIPPPNARPRRLWFETFLVIVVIGMAAWTYLHDAKARGPFTAELPPSYYGLLTEAILSGQTHLKLIPDPILLRLENPYAGPQGASRPHDMSFYKGKFYLYYGVTPVLILFGPWKLITGSYLTETAGTALFCFGGFLLATVWLLGVKRRLFNDVSPWITAGLVAVIAFGSPVFALSNNPTFYAVPISAGFFCLMVVLVLVDRCARAVTTGRVCVWLAAASLVHGLAVGARPNYFLGLAALLVPAWSLWRLLPASARSRLAGARIALAAVAPAAVVGLGLAWYNYARFESPVDFGIRFSLATGDLREANLMGAEFIPKNLFIYLLKPAALVRYYPFFQPVEDPFGALLHVTLAAAALMFPLAWFRHSLREDPVWRFGGWFLLLTAAANLAVLCLFFGGVDRYLVDFAPPALVLACAVFLALLAASTLAKWARFTLLALASLAGVWTLANGTAYGLSRRVETPLYKSVEAVANSVVGRIERAVGTEYGPVELKVVFPATNRSGKKDPLLSTETGTGAGDIIYAAYPDRNSVQIGFFHLGSGGPVSPPVRIDFDQPHTVVVRLGSLYPPAQHPFFKGWTPAEITAVRRPLTITLNGETILDVAANPYEATPDGLQIGANRIASDVTEPTFRGEIRSLRRLGLERPVPRDPHASGPVRLKLRLPTTRGGAPEPLVSTGVNGKGDLLNVQVLKDGRVRFSHDSWGSSDYVSDPVSTTLTQLHTVEIEMGSLYPPSNHDATPEQRKRLAVWLDGTLVMDTDRPFNPSAAEAVEFGLNAIEASSAIGMFTGTIYEKSRIPARPRIAAPEAWGPVQLTVKFATDATGLSDPLVATGVVGASDLVYVRYEDKNHVRFGHSHVGGTDALTEPIAVDYAREHQIEVTLGTLYPPSGHPESAARPAEEMEQHRRTFAVKLDGRTVLSVPRDTYPAGTQAPSIGRNDVDASTAQRVFSGQILQQTRAKW